MSINKLFYAMVISFSTALYAGFSEQQALRRIDDHLLLKDYHSAVEEGKSFADVYPTSQALKIAYIKSLCAIGDENESFIEFKKLSELIGGNASDRYLFESLAWGVLNKGEESSLLTIRLYSLLGAAFTQDARAIPVLLKELRSSNAILRSLAVKIASSYGDAPLQEALLKMLRQEKVWYVKLEVIQAIGRLGLSRAIPLLKEIVASSRTLTEEKAASLIALVSMYDNLEDVEFLTLIRSNRAGLRELACDLVAHLGKTDKSSHMISLLGDPCPAVRMAALNTLGLLGKQNIDGVDLRGKVANLFDDPSPPVAITAAWLSTVFHWPEGCANLARWIEQDNTEWKRMASAALASSGSYGSSHSLQILQGEQDPFVRANLSLGLIGQRQGVDQASKILFDFLIHHGHELWMWDSQYNSLFKSLAPSRVRHIDQIPRYPSVVDQHVKLDLLSFLHVIGHPRALDVVKSFLNHQDWGVSASAASTLLQEGDDQSLVLVRELLSDSDEKIRVQAALMLAMMGSDPEAVQTLEEAYFKVDREMKMYIIEALGRIGDQRSISFLFGVLQDPFQVLRVVAASALIQCIYH